MILRNAQLVLLAYSNRCPMPVGCSPVSPEPLLLRPPAGSEGQYPAAMMLHPLEMSLSAGVIRSPEMCPPLGIIHLGTIHFGPNLDGDRIE